ncbi:hypothetical protein ACH4U5_37970 [Streptomyces sp. NPDC020858]|uniref:hypothetical protein n=1 Tax=Streptomyces sp. NPDC020858 TaxID=3365097 RepID=UPI0037B20C25
MSRPAPGPHAHPLTPAELSAGDEWVHGCDECYLPVQGGAAGLTAHRRTVHHHQDDPRTPITVRLDLY